MDEEAIRQIQKSELEDFLKWESELSLSDRVRRYLEVKPHGIISNEHFSPASTECSLLYRDGHFYGCIAMTQAVAEALVKLLCQKTFGKSRKVFEKNVEDLSRRKFKDGGLKDHLLKIWDKRDDYHHLNSHIERDRQALENLAKEKVTHLAAVEKEVFAYSVIDGKLIPRHPRYWNTTGNQVQVYLRLE